MGVWNLALVFIMGIVPDVVLLIKFLILTGLK